MDQSNAKLLWSVLWALSQYQVRRDTRLSSSIDHTSSMDAGTVNQQSLGKTTDLGTERRIHLDTLNAKQGVHLQGWHFYSPLSWGPDVLLSHLGPGLDCR